MSALRKAGVWLGLVEEEDDDRSYDDGYESKSRYRDNGGYRDREPRDGWESRTSRYAEEFADEKLPTARPALVMLDDGADSAALLAGRRRLEAAADDSRVRVYTITATEGPDVGRFAALLATGRFAAIYLSLGLGRESVPDAGPRGLAG